jgi:hypothetical protein
VGNAQAGSAHQSCYWPEQRWRDVFDSLGLRVESWSSKLGLYPWPFSMVFERHLHFVARLALA